MRRLAVGVAVVVGLAAVAVAGAATVSIAIVRDGFRPAARTIQFGDTVAWTNRDTVPHQVVAENGAFASPVLGPGRSYSFVFRAAGTFRYRDALEPAERARIVVRGPPPSVALGVTAPIIRYGDQVHIQGRVSNGRANEQVTLFAQPYGQASFAQMTVVTTTAGGTFDFVVGPALLTSYQAVWRATRSQPASVQVRPKITLLPGRARGGWLRTKVTATGSFAGRWVYLQRRSALNQWVNVRKLKLGPQSGRSFRVRPTTRTRYRIFMTVNQAGAGYLDSWSGTQVVRGFRRR
jgi:plastocyanin